MTIYGNWILADVKVTWLVFIFYGLFFGLRGEDGEFGLFWTETV